MDSNQTVTGPKIVKRYANRKLYDAETSEYLTLQHIKQFVKAGREVKVLDNTSKKDITAVILLRSLVETELEREDLPLDQVTSMVKNGLFSNKV